MKHCTKYPFRWGGVFLFLFLTLPLFGQNLKERQHIQGNYNLPKIESLQKQIHLQQQHQKKKALDMAKAKGWKVLIQTKEGRTLELQGITPDGYPIYYTTFNAGAAVTSRADQLYTGGGLGLSLHGENMTAGVWDGGPVRATHELMSGRATQKDGAVFSSPNGNNRHALHVTGTIIGTDQVQSGNARGMAFKASSWNYDWSDDQSEGAAAAGDGLLLSNHSYGIAAFNIFGQLQIPVYYFGKYIESSKNWDEIMYNAPYYQMVNAAGNDRQLSGQVNNKGGYDILTGHSCSKNAIVVAAVNQVNNYTGASSVTMSAFSSWGPTDDGRIKPDISAKGVSTYSSVSDSDNSYATYSGTSMASPSTTGSLLLLQQHYNNLNSSYMRAATLRGLALHSADEAGSTDGPDYAFGWGLINTKRAAEIISNHGSASHVSEEQLSNNGTYTKTVTSDGSSPLQVSICWTDPAGQVLANTNDLATPALVNDLDVRVTQGGTTYYPWKLDPANPSAAATKGDNIVDNIESIKVDNASGSYVVTVTHKGSLSGGNQNFSVIISGISVSQNCTATVPSNVAVSNIQNNSAAVNWDQISGVSFDVRYRIAGSTSWQTLTATNNSASLTGLQGATNYEVQIRSICNGTPSDYSASVNFTTLASCTATVPTNIAASNIQSTSATINWDNIAGASFNLRYRIIGAGTWQTMQTSSNTASLAGLQANSDYEVQVRSNCDSNSSDYSASANFTTPDTPLTYCNSNGNNVSDEYIGRVQLEGIDNSSNAGSSGYQDFTSISTDLNKEQSYTITITPTWTGTIYSEGYAVWIDYNRDGTFGTDEKIWEKASSTDTPVSGSFSVPSSALEGTTRMRVSMKYNGIPTACETFTYGEVEDYSINILATAPDTEPPSVPDNLVSANITQTGADLSWNASTDNVGVASYDVFQDNSLIGNTASTSYSVTGLSASTTYDFTVKAKDIAGNISAASSILQVTTLDDQIEYCTTTGNNVNYEWIDYVALGNLANTTGKNGGYADFTSLTANVSYGANTIVVSAATTGTYTEYWKAWIDYDRDGSFEDGEVILEGSSSSTDNLSYNFTIPNTAQTGNTRMRVSMRYNTPPVACGNLTYGEVEDYTVNVSATANAEFNASKHISAEPIGNEPSTPFGLFPNPAKDRLQIIMRSEQRVKYQIVSLSGQVLQEGTANPRGYLSTGKLNRGAYIIRLSDGDNTFSKQLIIN
ncbi:MAG: GEVED domain-containing protein [Cytophagales bacterium]|nr:GEVED domain-containing protein [Cytophagales bacterium]